MVTMLNNQYQLDDNDFLSLTFSSKKNKTNLCRVLFQEYILYILTRFMILKNTSNVEWLKLTIN